MDVPVKKSSSKSLVQKVCKLKKSVKSDLKSDKTGVDKNHLQTYTRMKEKMIFGKVLCMQKKELRLS